MAVGSLHDLAAGYSQRSISSSTSRLSANISHLASGKRITKAMEDIASLSIATGLQSQVTSLRQASLNVAQASSMLQVADGGLNQIGDILQRMQAISVQANSGALDAGSRKGLNQEFQQLAQEIDRLSGNTNFNGVKLLDGGLANNASIATTGDAATQATGSLNFNVNMAAGQTVNINGVTLTAGTNFAVGGSVNQTLNNLAAALNSSGNPALSGASYAVNGNSLEITADVAGEAGNQFFINQGASTAAFFVSGNPLSGAGVFSLTGGTGDGIEGNSVSVSGSVADNLIAPVSNINANSTINFSSANDIQAGDTLQIDNGEGGFVTFTFVAGTPATANEIQIGGDLQETLQNAVSTLDNYTGADDYGIRQLDFARNGNSIEITSKAEGNPLDVAGAALNVNLGTTGGTITAAALNNGASAGVNANGVSNVAFVGNIQGFSATFNGADSVTASITIGDETYTANITDTTPGANQTVRFSSQNGGFFDVQLAGGNGQSVSNQAGADSFASRLDAAFSGLSFSQTRDVSNFNASGRLNGASLEFTGDDFSSLPVDDIRVSAGLNGDSAVIEFDIAGETYRSSAALGNRIGSGESITLESLDNPGRYFTLRNGINDIDLSSQSGADSFRGDLEQALNVNAGGGASFQVGSEADDITQFSIGDSSIAALFGGATPDLLSADSAAAAFGIIGRALDTLTSYRANVGSYQQSLDFTMANLESAIQNQEAARATLEDTDFAAESTLYAQNQVQQQASIATLAQTNRLSGNLLKLLVG